VLPGYRQFPFRVSPLAILVGVVGIVLWIGLCKLDWEHIYIQPALKPLKLDWLIGDRSAYNPFEELAGRPVLIWSYLAVRFFGLALVVPVIEEFFLRGFVMRIAVDQQNWWEVPFGKVNRLAVIVGTALPMLYHPEIVAAAVWFSLVTWLMLRTRNIWDCIAAHAVTNFLLGVYVVSSGEWRLM
jgi:CAAX prenyl protease-like protein